jgi:hypothetical protein
MANQRRKQAQRTEADVIDDVLSMLGRGLVMLGKALFGGGSGKATAAERTKRLVELRDAWNEVEMYAVQPAHAAQAVITADKLLDAAMQLERIPGVTMGERLKSAQSKFPHAMYQRVWDAHKLRNSIAHEVGIVVSSQQAGAAVASIREALYHLGTLR